MGSVGDDSFWPFLDCLKLRCGSEFASPLAFVPGGAVQTLMTVETEEERVKRELKEAKREMKKNMKMQQWLEEKARRYRGLAFGSVRESTRITSAVVHSPLTVSSVHCSACRVQGCGRDIPCWWVVAARAASALARLNHRYLRRVLSSCRRADTKRLLRRRKRIDNGLPRRQRKPRRPACERDIL